jgi:translation initiation factor 2B subunit (eIF-2B alpha/beta/delta family)
MITYRKLLLTDADKQLKDIAKIERKVTLEDDGDEPMEDIGEMILLIQEIIDDFDDGFIDISKTLQPHIGAEDIILTFGYSKLALACFQEAKDEDK